MRGKHVRFRGLRYTFATLSAQNGLDVKTLSAMLGHVSAATMDIYTYITDDMQRTAAANTDRGIGKVRLSESSSASGQEPTTGQPEKPRMTDFKPYVGRNVYAHTREAEGKKGKTRYNKLRKLKIG